MVSINNYRLRLLEIDFWKTCGIKPYRVERAEGDITRSKEEVLESVLEHNSLTRCPVKAISKLIGIDADMESLVVFNI